MNEIAQKKNNNVTSPRDRALMSLGGFHTIDRLTNALSSELMRTLEAFQEAKLHEELGYKRFVEFLDKSNISPMTRHQYYERKQALDQHGDAVFDLCTGLSFPVSKLKVLGAGSVRLDGETVIIQISETLEKTLDLKDKTAIIETITALTDAHKEKDTKLKRGESDYRNLQERVYALEEGSGATVNKKVAEIDKQHTLSLGSISSLITALKKASPEAVRAYAEGGFNLLALQVQELNTLICTTLEVEHIDDFVDFGGEHTERAASLLDD